MSCYGFAVGLIVLIIASGFATRSLVKQKLSVEYAYLGIELCIAAIASQYETVSELLFSDESQEQTRAAASVFGYCSGKDPQVRVKLSTDAAEILEGACRLIRPPRHNGSDWVLMLVTMFGLFWVLSLHRDWDGEGKDIRKQRVYLLVIANCIGALLILAAAVTLKG